MNHCFQKITDSRKRLISVFIACVFLLSVAVGTITVSAENAVTKTPGELYSGYTPIGRNYTAHSFSSPLGTWNAGDHTVYYLSDLALKDGGHDSAVLGNTKQHGDHFLYDFKTTNTSNYVGLNYTYKNAASLSIADRTYEKGIGLHPAGATTAGYVSFDLGSSVNGRTYEDCDAFYAIVGMTHNPAGVGCYFSVLGSNDKTTWTALARSEQLSKKMYGELNVNISGYRYIKLTVDTVGSQAISSCACAFANACIYQSDSSIQAPFAYLSNLDYSRVKTNNNDNFSADAPYGSAYVNSRYAFPPLQSNSGYAYTSGDPFYAKMVGLHATNLASDDFGKAVMDSLNIHSPNNGYYGSYIIYDLAANGVKDLYNTFYTRVGRTNYTGTDGESGGTVYILGSKGTGSETDAWTILAQSKTITGKTETCDIWADISGYNYLCAFVVDANGKLGSDGMGLLDAKFYQDTPVFNGVQTSKEAYSAPEYGDNIMDVRFVASVGVLSYEKVGLEISRPDKVYEIPSVDHVYKSIKGTVGTEEVTYTAESLNANYIFTVVIKAVPAGETVTFTVRPYYYSNGEKIYLTESTVTLNGVIAG